MTSTYKLGVGLLVHPLWAAIVITLAFVELPTALAVLATLATLTAPFAALPWIDRLDRLGARLRVVAPRQDRRERLAGLAQERSAVMAALEAARQRAEDAPPAGASAHAAGA